MRAFAGSTIRSTGIRIASITKIVTVWASTAEAGTSSRGNQTFLISSPFETSEVVPSWIPAWKKPHTARPGEHEQRVVRDVPGHLPEDREDERVDAHHRERVDQRPEEAERGALEARSQLAADERAQQLAVARKPAERRQRGSRCGVDGHRGQDTCRPDAHRRRRQPARAPAHRDRQLHPRDGRRARRGGRRRARAGRVRAVRAARARADPGGARRARRRGAHAARCRTRCGTAWSRSRPAAGRAARRPARRLPLLGLDVPAAARRPARDDRPRPGAAALPGLGRARDAAHARAASTSTPRATCDRIFVNSRFTGGEVVELLGVPRGAGARRLPRDRPALLARGRGGRPRRAVRARRRRRSSRARTCPRSWPPSRSCGGGTRS